MNGNSETTAHSRRRRSPAVLVADDERLPQPTVYALAHGEQIIGRGSVTDVQIEAELADGVSRRHAVIRSHGARFTIADLNTSNGTYLNDKKLEAGKDYGLTDGDRIQLGGSLKLVFRALGARPQHDLPEFYDRFLGLGREMNSLDLRTVVKNALELLRLVSDVDRSFLVGAGVDPRYDALLTPLDDPDLKLSRSTIRLALERGEKVTRDTDSDDVGSTPSIHELDLGRLWVSPVFGHDAKPVAAVYLDSVSIGGGFDTDRERLMDAVVEQIGLALRNAALHSEILGLNQSLEQKVLERTRQLEASQAALIGQDRLATLGRLVAAIAHELNNPVGAMASFAQTIEQLVGPVIDVGERLKSLLSGPEQEAMARHLLDATLSSAVGKPLDTRSRRKLTDELRVVLAEAGIASPEEAARRLARLGLSSDKVRGSIDLIRDHDHQLVALLEQVHTFGRGVATIRDCSSGVARIVEGLKTYAHLDQASVEEADLHRGIEAALAVLQSQIPADVQVETHFDNIGPFPHRPGELTQVWTNLIDNAVRAMGERGRLLIETRDLGETVRVTVEDSGPGIPSGLRDTIFDLHATTRGPGAGLGLGLPICRAIVERNHGGQIDFESVPGRTAFTVTIPKTPAREQETTK